MGVNNPNSGGNVKKNDCHNVKNHLFGFEMLIASIIFKDPNSSESESNPKKLIPKSNDEGHSIIINNNNLPIKGGTTPNFNAIGTYPVTYTATDAAGNTSTITHNYQVNAAPVLSSTTQTFTTTVGTALTLPTITANDVVDGVVAVLQGGTTPNFNAIGIYPVTYTATDIDGNVSTITHTYIINALPDTVAPVFPNTMSFSGVTPDTKNNQYTGLSLTPNNSIIGGTITSLTSSNGGTLSTPTIDGTGKIIFKFFTPNVSGTTLTVIGTDATGNAFTITLNVSLPLAMNINK